MGGVLDKILGTSRNDVGAHQGEHHGNCEIVGNLHFGSNNKFGSRNEFGNNNNNGLPRGEHKGGFAAKMKDKIHGEGGDHKGEKKKKEEKKSGHDSSSSSSDSD